VFRHVPSGIHAVGWNKGFKKTFVCSAGSSNPGKEALHKRQRDNGATFQRRVKCPDVISTCQEAAGAVDKHNSFRQGTLRLEHFWKTQLHQNRMFVCMMSACMANAFLAWENELGRCDEPEQRDMATGSRIIRFVVRVIDAMLPSLQGGCSGSAGQTHHPCQLETIGGAVTKTGNNPGRKHTIMNACSACVAKKNRHGVGDKRARTTARRCKVHKGILLCRLMQVLGTAWRSTRPSMRSAFEGRLLLRKGLRSGRPQIRAGPATFMSKNRHPTLFFLAWCICPLLKPY
jgi:hypothetical protein